MTGGNAWGRVEKRSRGLNVDVCDVCGHQWSVNRCMAPEEEAVLDATLDEAIQALIDENTKLIHDNADLRRSRA